jgi:predicted amidophosphoribosyltransferase
MKRIQQQAIEHYDRMIAWAEKQPARDHADFSKMEIEIHEDYYSEDCVYCQKFIYKCRICPLGNEIEQCCNELWFKMDDAKTWRTWLKYARLVRQYIIDNG